VNECSGATFFLDGPIGIGKTYVYNTIVTTTIHDFLRNSN
jgi:hypothetical protein